MEKDGKLHVGTAATYQRSALPQALQCRPIAFDHDDLLTAVKARVIMIL
jgi:hypothetical protein